MSSWQQFAVAGYKLPRKVCGQPFKSTILKTTQSSIFQSVIHFSCVAVHSLDRCEDIFYPSESTQFRPVGVSGSNYAPIRQNRWPKIRNRDRGKTSFHVFPCPVWLCLIGDARLLYAFGLSSGWLRHAGTGQPEFWMDRLPFEIQKLFDPGNSEGIQSVLLRSLSFGEENVNHKFPRSRPHCIPGHYGNSWTRRTRQGWSNGLLYLLRILLTSVWLPI